jgi:menaquinone-9 beta-reductase
VRPVIATGPFAAWSRRVIAPGGGALLVGDASDFFDPFTGEGIYSALKGAELVADTVTLALAQDQTAPLSAALLAPYARARRRAFLGKWVVERMVGYAMWFPWLFDRAVARLERNGLSHTFLGVTGDFVPPRAVLDPRFLVRMVF